MPKASGSPIFVEHPTARIQLPQGAKLTSDFPQLVATVGKSTILVDAHPDPYLWAVQITEWDQTLSLTPNHPDKVVRSRPRQLPYLGREYLVETPSYISQPSKYSAKILLINTLKRRRAQIDIIGSGTESDFDTTWSACIDSFEFLGPANPLESLFSEQHIIPIDEACTKAAAEILARLDLDLNSEGWLEAPAKLKGFPTLRSVMLRIIRTPERDEDVTKYTIGVVNGQALPCGGMAFFESLAEAIADSRDTLGVPCATWTVTSAPEWASVVDEAIHEAYDSYVQAREHGQ